MLGQAGKLAKSRDGEIASDGLLHENCVVSILGFNCLEIILRRAGA
jgi:hypothetical protein